MKTHAHRIALAALTASVLSSPVFAEDWTGQARDAWIDGKLEASYLLNSELNNFRIGTEVQDGRVVLSGSVPSDAHKALAEEIAANLDEVTTVTNNLSVDTEGELYSDSEQDFSSKFFDMTTTVSLKSRYALSSELEAHEIDIDTSNGVVTLNGEVETNAARELAEEIATSYDHVSQVNNNLRILAAN